MQGMSLRGTGPKAPVVRVLHRSAAERESPQAGLRPQQTQPRL